VSGDPHFVLDISSSWVSFHAKFQLPRLKTRTREN
jgi:hypothetical protein